MRIFAFPSSERNQRRLRRVQQRGFTLLEILVVLFIVGIMAGVTVINMPRFAFANDFDHETERLRVVLNQLREEALIQATEFGFQPDRDGYRFFIYDEFAQAWRPYGETPFRTYEWEEPIVVSLAVEDSEVQLGGSDDDEQAAPPVLILSSGEVTPFTLTLQMKDEGLERTLVSRGYTPLEWQDPNAPE